MRAGHLFLGKAGLSSLALLFVAVPAGAGQQTVSPESGVPASNVPTDMANDPSTADQAKVEKLSILICNNLEKVRVRKPLDLEASIASTLSQVDVEIVVKAAALINVGTRCPMNGLQTAVAGAQRALSGGRLEGTAGLAGHSFDNSSSFQAPFVDVGGGSVNYTTGA